jgi:hypothetical protein
MAVLPENTYCLIFLTFFRGAVNLVSSVYVPLVTRGYLPLFRSGTKITPSRTVRLGQPLQPMEGYRLKRNQMTLNRKTGMEGVAEETGIAPAKI